MLSRMHSSRRPRMLLRRPRVDDRADNSDAEMDVESRQQPVADEGADDSDDNAANQPKMYYLLRPHFSYARDSPTT
jgi:hypothetical protein